MMGSKLSPADMAKRLPFMGKEETKETLQSYTAVEIKELAKAAGLTIPKSAPKWQAIELIAGHFAYLRVHRGMMYRN